jgi:hypothetical protein
MNSKDIKKYSLINQILTSKVDAPQMPVLINELGVIDFGVGFEVWEYTLGTFQKDLADNCIAENLERQVFENFLTQSETKTKQLLAASDPLMRLVYGACATSCTGKNLEVLVGYILAGKIDTADTILNAVRSNPTGDFGERMRVIVVSVFETYCQIKGVKKCELTRKQSTLLLEHINKIKGPNKMLLTQRIKEL